MALRVSQGMSGATLGPLPKSGSANEGLSTGFSIMFAVKQGAIPHLDQERRSHRHRDDV
jgi:hypothetical protein